MSKFPVELSDGEGQVDAINYLLSGPSGLGQNFAGVSFVDTETDSNSFFIPTWLTGYYRTPYSIIQGSPKLLYITPIPFSTIEFLDDRTLRCTFTTPQPNPPFEPGTPVFINNASDPWYDGAYRLPGIIGSTTTDCTIRLSRAYPILPSATGGTIEIDTSTFLSTDCIARVNVTSVTDRNFIGAQLIIPDIQFDVINLDPISNTNTIELQIQLNRYKGEINTDPVNPDFVFEFDKQIITRNRRFVYNTTGLKNLSDIETNFISIIDTAPVGLYEYYVEINLIAEVLLSARLIYCKLGNRSISAQVVKE